MTRDSDFTDLVDAVLAGARALVGVAVQSIAPVEGTLTLSQFRTLVIIASRGPMHSAALADEMRLHPSNVTRSCDRLVAAGFLERRENSADRRLLILTLTPAGRGLVDGVMHRRRLAVADILGRVPQQHQGPLIAAFTAFADAAGEPPEQELWPAPPLGVTGQVSTIGAVR